MVGAGGSSGGVAVEGGAAAGRGPCGPGCCGPEWEAAGAAGEGKGSAWPVLRSRL